MTVKTILLAEDDSDDRDLFVNFYSHRTDIRLLPPVENGLELIEYLKGVPPNDGLPDLIVLDQNMPKMNGKQAIAFLKSHPRFAPIPAVIYSTYTDSKLIVDCKTLGADMVASKPIDFDGYQRMMDDFLRLVYWSR